MGSTISLLLIKSIRKTMIEYGTLSSLRMRGMFSNDPTKVLDPATAIFRIKSYHLSVMIMFASYLEWDEKTQTWMLPVGKGSDSIIQEILNQYPGGYLDAFRGRSMALRIIHEKITAAMSSKQGGRNSDEVRKMVNALALTIVENCDLNTIPIPKYKRYSKNKSSIDGFVSNVLHGISKIVPSSSKNSDAPQAAGDPKKDGAPKEAGDTHQEAGAPKTTDASKEAGASKKDGDAPNEAGAPK
jgi:hypothetical protein